MLPNPPITSFTCDKGTYLMSIHCAQRAAEFYKIEQKVKLTAAGIPTWSPTVVLISRSTAYVWQSGRDAQFSAACGRK